MASSKPTNKKAKTSRSSKGSAGILARRLPLTSMLAVMVAAFCVVGGFALLSHSFAAAASSSPEVASGFSGMCLDDWRDGKGNGNIVDLFKCNGTQAQQWSVYTSGKVTVNGKCLDVYQQGKSNGQIVDLYTCNGGKNQQWTYKNYTLVSAQSGKCLQAPANMSGLQLQIWTCNGSTNQRWTITRYVPGTASGGTTSANGTPVSSTTSSNSGSNTGSNTNGAPVQAPVTGSSTTPEVASGYTGKCLDDWRNGTGNDNVVDLYTCNGTAAQQWAVNTNGQVTIHGKCLDVYRQGTSNGQIVDLFTCNGGKNQQWTYKNYTLVSAQSGKCLQAPANQSGLQLQIWSCNTVAGTTVPVQNQQWTVTRY